MRELVTAVVGGEAAVRGHTALVAHGFSGRTLGPRCVAKRNAPGQALCDQDSPFDPGGIQPPPMLRGALKGRPGISSWLAFRICGLRTVGTRN